MLTSMGSKLTYSNVVSTIALFSVMATGTAFAAGLAKDSVKSKQIKDNAVKSKDLKDDKAVTGADVVDDSLEGADINEATLNISQRSSTPPSGAAGGDLTGNYPSPLIANNKVNSAKIADGSVSTADLAGNAVNSAKIADGSVNTGDLAGNAVNSAKIADGSVNTGDLADNAVNSAKVADNTLTANDLGANSVAASEIQTDGVGEVELAANSVSADELLGITEVSNTSSSTAPGGIMSVVATCPSGSQIISGGGFPSSFGVKLVTTSRSGNSWLVQAVNDTTSNQTLTARAYCLVA